MSRNYDVTINLPKPPSLNKLYAGSHWQNRHNDKSEYWRGIATELAKYPLFCAESISVHLRYNYRFDVDNAIVAIKFLVDFLRNHGYIENDTPKYFTAISTVYDNNLEKGRFTATISCIGYKEVHNDANRTIQLLLDSSKKAPRVANKSVRGTTRRTGKSTTVTGKGRNSVRGLPKGRKKRI